MSEFVDLIIKMREMMRPCDRKDNLTCAKCPLVYVCTPDAVDRLVNRALYLAAFDDDVAQNVLAMEYRRLAENATDDRDDIDDEWDKEIKNKIAFMHFD